MYFKTVPIHKSFQVYTLMIINYKLMHRHFIFNTVRSGTQIIEFQTST